MKRKMFQAAIWILLLMFSYLSAFNQGRESAPRPMAIMVGQSDSSPTLASTATPTSLPSPMPQPSITATTTPVWNRTGRDYLLPFPGSHISPFGILISTGYYTDLAIQMASSVNVSFPYNAVKRGIAFKYCDVTCVIFFGEMDPVYWPKLVRHEYGHIFAFYYGIDMKAFAKANLQLKHPLSASYNTEGYFPGEIYASAQEISPCELKRKAASLISFFPQYKPEVWNC